RSPCLKGSPCTACQLFLSRRARRSRVHPRLDERPESRLRTRRWLAARTGVPGPAHKRIARHVLDDLGEAVVAIAGGFHRRSTDVGEEELMLGPGGGGK